MEAEGGLGIGLRGLCAHLGELGMAAGEAGGSVEEFCDI